MRYHSWMSRRRARPLANCAATLAIIAIVAAFSSACEGLIGADFSHGAAGADIDADTIGADGAPADGSVLTDGAPLPLDAGGGSRDGSSAKDGGALDGSVTGRTPLDIFGPSVLKVWLDANKALFTSGGNPNVLAWNDQSGNMVNGGPAGAGGGQLTRLTNDIHGGPAVKVDGDALSLGSKSPSIAATDDFYIGMVARYQTLGGSQDRFFFSRFSAAPHGFALYAGSQGSSAVAGTLDVAGIVQKAADTTTADDTYRVYALRRTGSAGANVTLEVRVNGVVTSATIPNGIAVTDPNRPLLFGGSMDGAALDRFMFGAFAEIVVLQGTTSDQSITEMESNLRAKYALP